MTRNSSVSKSYNQNLLSFLWYSMNSRTSSTSVPIHFPLCFSGFSHFFLAAFEYVHSQFVEEYYCRKQTKQINWLGISIKVNLGSCVRLIIYTIFVEFSDRMATNYEVNGSRHLVWKTCENFSHHRHLNHQNFLPIHFIL